MRFSDLWIGGAAALAVIAVGLAMAFNGGVELAAGDLQLKVHAEMERGLKVVIQTRT